MSAGSVRAPLIIPLRLPAEGQHKNTIDNVTQIEISSDTRDAEVYFTVDGTRPNPLSWKSRRPQPGPTYQFKEPFTLPPGTKTIRAVAVSATTNQESNVVTKTFEVIGLTDASMREADRTFNPTRDCYGFLDDLKSEKSIILRASTGDLSRPSGNNARNKRPVTPIYRPSLLRKSSMKDDVFTREDKPRRLSARAPLYSKGIVKKKAPASDTDDKPRRQSSTVPRRKKNVGGVCGEGDREGLPTPLANSHYVDLRLEKDVNPYACQTCLAARPVDPEAFFCTACGSALPKLPSQTAVSPKLADLDMCSNCGSQMSVSSKMCLVCEAPAAAGSAGVMGETFSLERRLCCACGSLNPAKARVCLTCETSLPTTAASLVNLSSILPRRSPREGPPKRSSPPAAPSSPRTRQPQSANCRVCYRQNTLGSRFCDWCGIQDPCDGETGRLGDAAGLREDEGVCPKCFWQAPGDSRFCPQCGFNITGVQRPASMFDPPKRKSNWLTSEVGGSRRTDRTAPKSVESASHHSIHTQSRPCPPTSDLSTQTTGLFFPSSAQMKLAGLNRFCPTAEDANPKSRPLALAPVSPGKGLWRMQLEHVVAHLKAYTRNSLDFRQALGKPRMGRILFADVEEDNENISLVVTFKRPSGRLNVFAGDGNPNDDPDECATVVEQFGNLPRRGADRAGTDEVTSSHPSLHASPATPPRARPRQQVNNSNSEALRASRAQDGKDTARTRSTSTLAVSLTNSPAAPTIDKTPNPRGWNDAGMVPQGDAFAVEAATTRQLAHSRPNADPSANGIPNGSSLLDGAVPPERCSENFISQILKLGGDLSNNTIDSMDLVVDTFAASKT